MILEKLKVEDRMSLLGLEIRYAWKPNGVVRHQGTECQLSYLDVSICMITLFSCLIRLSCWHQPTSHWSAAAAGATAAASSF